MLRSARQKAGEQASFAASKEHFLSAILQYYGNDAQSKPEIKERLGIMRECLESFDEKTFRAIAKNVSHDATLDLLLGKETSKISESLLFSLSFAQYFSSWLFFGESAQERMTEEGKWKLELLIEQILPKSGKYVDNKIYLKDYGMASIGERDAVLSIALMNSVMHETVHALGATIHKGAGSLAMPYEETATALLMPFHLPMKKTDQQKVESFFMMDRLAFSNFGSHFPPAAMLGSEDYRNYSAHFLLSVMISDKSKEALIHYIRSVVAKEDFVARRMLLERDISAYTNDSIFHRLQRINQAFNQLPSKLKFSKAKVDSDSLREQLDGARSLAELAGVLERIAPKFVSASKRQKDDKRKNELEYLADSLRETLRSLSYLQQLISMVDLTERIAPAKEDANAMDAEERKQLIEQTLMRIIKMEKLGVKGHLVQFRKMIETFRQRTKAGMGLDGYVLMQKGDAGAGESGFFRKVA